MSLLIDVRASSHLVRASLQSELCPSSRGMAQISPVLAKGPAPISAKYWDKVVCFFVSYV